MPSGLWKVTAHCGCIWKRQAMESSPRRHLPSSVRCQAHFICSAAQKRHSRGSDPAASPEMPKPHHQTVDNLIKLSIDGEHSFHVFFFQFTVSVPFSQKFKHSERVLIVLYKGFPKPSTLNCPGLLSSPSPAPLTVCFQVTPGIRYVL